MCSMNLLSACQAQIICTKEEIHPKVLEFLEDILKRVENTSKDGHNEYLYYFLNYVDTLQYLDSVCLILRRLGYTMVSRRSESTYVEPFGVILIKW